MSTVKYTVEHEGSERLTDSYESILKLAFEAAEYYEDCQVTEKMIDWTYGVKGLDGNYYVEAIFLNDQLFAVESKENFHENNR